MKRFVRIPSRVDSLASATRAAGVFPLTNSAKMEEVKHASSAPPDHQQPCTKRFWSVKRSEKMSSPINPISKLGDLQKRPQEAGSAKLEDTLPLLSRTLPVVFQTAWSSGRASCMTASSSIASLRPIRSFSRMYAATASESSTPELASSATWLILPLLVPLLLQQQQQQQQQQREGSRAASSTSTSGSRRWKSSKWREQRRSWEKTCSMPGFKRQ
mmetsp:Transcript_47551/g.101739  ORF Transcript_47551/g.101739 Transcript_47551/m.101739 type:complete len:215 (-) Transcript_47551:2399-3043(-)